MTEVVNRSTLLAGCQVFDKKFDRNFAAWHSSGLTLENLAEEVVTLASTLASTLANCDVGRWTQAVRNALPLLLDQIFAYFTISMSGQSYTRVMDDQIVCELAETVLPKAHNIQILTILRLLGYDSGNTDTDLASHVTQIRAGEGKSIILGACSALSALLGFRVRCVCCTDYLATGFAACRPSEPQEAGEEILLVDEVVKKRWRLSSSKTGRIAQWRCSLGT